MPHLAAWLHLVWCSGRTTALWTSGSLSGPPDCSWIESPPKGVTWRRRGRESVDGLFIVVHRHPLNYFLQFQASSCCPVQSQENRVWLSHSLTVAWPSIQEENCQTCSLRAILSFSVFTESCRFHLQSDYRRRNYLFPISIQQIIVFVQESWKFREWWETWCIFLATLSSFLQMKSWLNYTFCLTGITSRIWWPHYCESRIITNNTVCNLPRIVQEAEVSSFQCFPCLVVCKFVSERYKEVSAGYCHAALTAG